MKKGKKILVFLSYHLPNISGITIETQRLSEELIKRGFSVTILTSKHKKNLPGEEITNKVKVIRLPVITKIGKQPIQPSFLWTIIKHIHQADIIHIHWPYAESFYVALWAKLLNTPIFITHHVDEPDFSTMSKPIRKVSKKALFISQLISGKIAKNIIPRTKDYADHSALLQKFKNKLLFCPPLIYDFPPDSKDLNYFRNLFSQYKYKIGFSGRVSRQKGIPYLLKAIPLLKDQLGENFVIAFAGPNKDVIGENHLKEIKPLIKKYQNNLLFLGNLKHDKLFAFYQIIDCLVLPSIHRAESFGQVQVESMYRGTPVIATNLPGSRIPIKKTGMGEIVKPKDEKKLANAILSVLLNLKEYKYSRKKVVKAFNPQKVISFYEKLFLSA